MKPVHPMKLLVRLGQTSLALTLLLLLAGGRFIPAFAPQAPATALRIRSGLPFRHIDTTLTRHFVRSLRAHGGVLCMGTSETTTLADGNWPDFLNADGPRAAVLAGAGRTAGVHLPWMWAAAGEWSGVDLVYFLNPVYWNAQLADIEPEYWLRYATPSGLRQIRDPHPDLAHPVLNALPVLDRWHPGPALRSARRPWFQDLRWHFSPREFDQTFAPLTPWRGQLPLAPDTNIDLETGALRTFAHPDWFSPARPAGQAPFRDAELRAFVDACDRLDIRLTIVLGPPNLPFIRHHDPSALAASHNLQAHLRQLLDGLEVRYLDCSDIGEIPGAFNDHQHISSYGAFLIAQRLRQSLGLPKLQP